MQHQEPRLMSRTEPGRAANPGPDQRGEKRVRAGVGAVSRERLERYVTDGEVAIRHVWE